MNEAVDAQYYAELAFLPAGWARGVVLEVDAGGDLTGVRTGSRPPGAELLAGPVLPGMPNVHSHAFQRAFAGRAERRTHPDDSFWTWREAMYAVAERIDPEQFEAIAAWAYLEMLRAGYTSVGEFHYLHRDPNAQLYARRGELGRRAIAAGERTGIAMTLLPVFYRYADFGAREPEPRQRRFILSSEEYLALWDDLRAACKGLRDVRLGVAPHSLRAVEPKQLTTILAHVRRHDAGAPVHIHVAEQQREVDAALAYLGARPVAWLLQEAGVDERWCLVHATHLDEAETRALAKSAAVAGLCPTTEANLGDGLFSLQPYLADHGRFGIGSDSHVSIDVREELRWLEYGQRLLSQRRVLACDEATPSAGEYLYAHAATGGATALGRVTGALQAGRRADFVVLDERAIAGGVDDAATLLDRYLFATAGPAVRDVAVGGRWVLRDGRHREDESIERAYRATLSAVFGPS